MPRLRCLDTLGVACALLGAAHLMGVPPTDACNWRAALTNYTTQETTYVRLDATPVQIPLLHDDHGVNVHCSLEPSTPLSVGIFQRSQVDIRCRYPDTQLMSARALHIMDTATGNTIVHPVVLFFSTARKPAEPLYRLHVECHLDGPPG